MGQSQLRRRYTIQLMLAALLATTSGCALFAPEPEPPPVIEIPEPEPEPVVEIPEPEPEPEPEPPPPPPEPVAVIPETFAAPVAVVLSSRQAAYEGVANELALVLEDHTLYDLSDRSLSVRDVFASIESERATAVVAIGLRAALVAKNFAKVPVVFCQVFNVEENELISDQRKGIAPIPPLELQLKAWLELDPALKNVGAILGEGHEELIAEAQLTTRTAGVNLHYRMVGSDRETLYVFNRLVPDIDGFFLFPDNRVLSRTVLTEMLSYASRHHVQVAVFNDTLLGLGATISASAVDADIASSVVVVLDKFANGQSETVPDITPLSEIRIRTNDAMVRKFGLLADEPAPQDAVAGAL